VIFLGRSLRGHSTDLSTAMIQCVYAARTGSTLTAHALTDGTLIDWTRLLRFVPEAARLLCHTPVLRKMVYSVWYGQNKH
jgi:hypothetical protein